MPKVINCVILEIILFFAINQAKESTFVSKFSVINDKSENIEDAQCQTPFKNQLEQQNIQYSCTNNTLYVKNQKQINVNLTLQNYQATNPLIKFISIENLNISVNLDSIELVSQQVHQSQYLILIYQCGDVNVSQLNVTQYFRQGQGLGLANFVSINSLTIQNLVLSNSSYQITINQKKYYDLFFDNIQNMIMKELRINSFNLLLFIQAINFQLTEFSVNSDLNQNHIFILDALIDQGTIVNTLLTDTLTDTQSGLQIQRIITFFPKQILTLQVFQVQSINYYIPQNTSLIVSAADSSQFYGQFILNYLGYIYSGRGIIPSDTVTLTVQSTMMTSFSIYHTDFSIIPFRQFRMIFVQGSLVYAQNIALRNCNNESRFIEMVQVQNVTINNYSIDHKSLQNLPYGLFLFDSVYNVTLVNLQIPIDPPFNEREQYFVRNGSPIIQYFPTSQISFIFGYIFMLVSSVINLKNTQSSFANFNNIDLSFFEMYDSSLSNVYSPLSQNGGCLQFKSNNTQIFLRNAIFDTCGSLQLGGAIYGGYITTAQNVTIQNCSSKLAGGGVVLSKITQIKEIENILFINNKARYSNDDYLLGFENITIDSIYEYNQNYQQTNLYMKQLQVNPLTNHYQMYSGLVYLILLKFSPLYPQQGDFNIPTNLDTVLQVHNSQFQSYLVPNFTQPYLILYQNPSLLMKDQTIELTLIDNYFIQTKFAVNDNSCDSGMELIYLQNMYKMCKYCDVNSASYSSTNNQNLIQLQDRDQINGSDQQDHQVCKYCNFNMFNSCYANYSYLRPGYWRSEYTVNEDSIYQCEISSTNCAGGSEIGNYLCQEGSIGVQCLDCDTRGTFWNKTYGSSGVFECNRCGDSTTNNIRMIFSITLLFLLVTILIQSNFQSIRNIIYANYLSKLQLLFIGSSLYRKSKTSVLIKILSFNFSIYQLSSLVSQNNLLNYLGFLQTNPIDSQFVSIDCFLSQVLPSNYSIGLSKLILCILFPTAALISILLFQTILSLFKKMKLSLIFNIGVMAYTYLFVFSFYTYTLQYSVQSLKCFTLNSSQSYSMVDLSLQCENDSSLLSKIRIIGIITLIVICCISPCFLFLQLFQRRYKLQKVDVLLRYGFIYREYKPQFYYWEIIRLLLKVSLVVIKVSFLESLTILSIFFSIFLVLYMIIFISIKPYTSRQFNKIEIFTITVALVNIFGSSLYRQSQDQSIVDSNKLFFKIFYYVSQGIQIIFFLYLVLLIILSFFTNSLTKLQRYRYFTWLSQYFPLYSQRLKNNFKKLRLVIKQQKTCNLSSENETLIKQGDLTQSNLFEIKRISNVNH